MNNSGFDRIAGAYDTLASVLFGSSISSSATAFLSRTGKCRNIIVLGGGTGNFLPELLRHSDGEVWFIDASVKMIARAKQRTPAPNVHFIHGTEESIPAGIVFDAVLTFFYLDLFDEAALARIVAFIKKSLSADAVWLAADFRNTGKWWQPPLLRLMYFFFYLVCGLKTKALPDWKRHLLVQGFDEIQGRLFSGGFIQSAVFRAKHRSLDPFFQPQ